MLAVCFLIEGERSPRIHACMEQGAGRGKVGGLLTCTHACMMHRLLADDKWEDIDIAAVSEGAM